MEKIAALVLSLSPLAAFVPIGGQEPREAAGRSPELRVLASLAGEWETTTTMKGNPWVPAAPMAGKETARLVAGGGWLLQEAAGEGYAGAGLVGFDREKGRFVSVWVDQHQPGMSVSEGSWDAAAKALVMESEGPDFTGRKTRWRSATTVGDGEKTEVVSYLGEGGEWVEAIRIVGRK